MSNEFKIEHLERLQYGKTQILEEAKMKMQIDRNRAGSQALREIVNDRKMIHDIIEKSQIFMKIMYDLVHAGTPGKLEKC